MATLSGRRQRRYIVRSCLGGADDRFVAGGSEDSRVGVPLVFKLLRPFFLHAMHGVVFIFRLQVACMAYYQWWRIAHHHPLGVCYRCSFGTVNGADWFANYVVTLV